MDKILWKDKKRIWFGLPWSFTTYTLTENKFLVDKGFFNKVQDEVRLYRIMDLTLKRSFWERLFGLGTIHCCSGDKSTPEFDIQRIKKSKEVKEMLSDCVEEARKNNRIGTREYMQSQEDEDHNY